MADFSSSIFNKKATEKLRTPDDLDKFVRVTNPSIWVVLGACLALLIGLMAWGFFGSVTTSLTLHGAHIGRKTVCFLTPDQLEQVTAGDAAVIEGKSFTVSDVSSVPLSLEEVSEILESDYLVSTLAEGDWVYQVTFDGPSEELLEGVPLDVRITTEQVAPVSLILANRS